MFSCNFKLQSSKSSETNLKVGLSNMLNNFQYFLVLAEELNISKAADRLFISHQCLSKYLKNLEDEYGVMLFHRKPKFALTYAGELVLQSLRKIELIDANLSSQLAELQDGKTGEVRIGITEGRLRIMIPDLLEEFKKLYPNILVKVISAPSPEMLEQLLQNKLDFIVAGSADNPNPNLIYQTILNERLYLVISDNLLQQYFGDKFLACKKAFSEQGVDLCQLKDVPFVLNYKGFSSRTMLDNYLFKLGTQLNVIYEATQPDLHLMMAARDYAATICLTMYLPNVWQLNEADKSGNKLNVFHIAGLNNTNPVFMISTKGKYMPEYARQLCSLIKKQCQYYENIHY